MLQSLRTASVICAALAAATLSPAPSRAESGDTIGATISVINIVTAAYNRDTRTLVEGDDVRQDEVIDVGSDASTEMRLNDDTKLALGAGAKMKLDKFVYDSEKSAGTIGVNLVKGAFRFITGVASKPSYVIKVPNASITVRGTVFDVFVQDDDTSWLLLVEGAVQVCNERGICRLHDQPGKMLRITPVGDVGVPTKWAGLPGNEKHPFDEAFPFISKPPMVDPTPVFSREDIILGNVGGNDDEPKYSPPPRRTDNDDDYTPKKPRKSPTKKAEKQEYDPPKKKRERPTKTAKGDDGAAAKAVLGIGLSIGLGSIGRGGGRGHGGGGGYSPH